MSHAPLFTLVRSPSLRLHVPPFETCQLSIETRVKLLEMMSAHAVIILHLLAARRCAAGQGLYSLPPWEFEDEVTMRFRKKCGNSKVMAETCGDPLDLGADLPLDLFTKPDSPFKVHEATRVSIGTSADKADDLQYYAMRFPDLHCVATYVASGKMKTATELNPKHACGCATCESDVQVARVADELLAFDLMKLAAAEVQNYEKTAWYKECDDQSFWDNAFDRIQEQRREYNILWGDVICPAYLSVATGPPEPFLTDMFLYFRQAKLGRRSLETEDSTVYLALPAPSFAQAAEVSSTRRQMGVRDRRHGWCTDECRQWLNCAHDFVAFEDVGIPYFLYGDITSPVGLSEKDLPGLSVKVMQKMFEVQAAGAFCPSPSSLRRWTIAMIVMEVVFVAGVSFSPSARANPGKPVAIVMGACVSTSTIRFCKRSVAAKSPRSCMIVQDSPLCTCAWSYQR